MKKVKRTEKDSDTMDLETLLNTSSARQVQQQLGIKSKKKKNSFHFKVCSIQ